MAESKKTYRLPVKKDISTVEIGPVVAAVLMVAMSLIGLFLTNSIYPAEAQVHSYKTNDLVNLLIGLPALLASIGLARRSRWIGLLFWPAALLYVLYNYTAMLVGVTPGWPMAHPDICRAGSVERLFAF